MCSSCAKEKSQLTSIPTTVLHSGRAQHIVTLPSGYRLKLIAVGPVYSAPKHQILGVMLQYMTDIPQTNLTSLAHEADAIFKYFHVDAERAGYSSAILAATEPARGFLLTRTDGYRFLYVRDQTGKWRRMNGPK